MSDDFLIDGALLDEGDLEPEAPIELPLDDGDELPPTARPMKKDDDTIDPVDDDEDDVDLDEDEGDEY